MYKKGKYDDRPHTPTKNMSLFPTLAFSPEDSLIEFFLIFGFSPFSSGIFKKIYYGFYIDNNENDLKPQILDFYPKKLDSFVKTINLVFFYKIF